MTVSQEIGDMVVSEDAVETRANKQEQRREHPQPPLSPPRTKRPTASAEPESKEAGQEKVRVERFVKQYQCNTTEQIPRRTTNHSVDLLWSEPDHLHGDGRVCGLT